MKLFSITLLIAVLPLALCRDSHTCASLSCHAPLKECCEQSFGAQCYNPEIHLCAEHKSSLYLCPLSYPHACARACYNASEYHCVDDKLVRGPEPSIPTDAPSQPTDEPQQPTTEPDSPTSCAHLTCTGHLSECCEQSFGAQCYNPQIHRCAEYKSSLYLCPLSYPNACGRACYNSSEYHCVDDKLVRGAEPNIPTEAPSQPTDEPQQPTAESDSSTSCAHLTCSGRLSECCLQSFGAQCYDPLIHTCAQFNSSHYLCPLYYPKACGRACYHPSEYHCEKGELKQGAEESESDEEPHTPTDEPEGPGAPAASCAHLSCAGRLSECCLQSFGAQCYDPAVHTCAVFNSSYYLCPVNHPKACGSACYHPSQYHCAHGELKQGAESEQPPTAGPTDAPPQNHAKCSESNCASAGLSCCEMEVPDGSIIAQCYSNTTYTCKGKVLCLLGLESCGHACYHTDYFTCENEELKTKPHA